METAKIVRRKYVLCDDFLQNVYENGVCKGFQIKLRVPNYRGLRLCLLGGLKVIVDGVEYPEDALLITSCGETFEFREIETVTEVYWPFEQPVTVTVKTDKPLEKGMHKVEAYAAVRITYHNELIYEGSRCDICVE